MKQRVLVSAPYLQPSLGEFRQFFTDHDIEVIHPPVRERLSEAELLNLVMDIDGAVCGDDRFTETVLKSATRLKVIVKWGTGIDSIDVDAARRLGIRVCNTPGAFTDAVADTVLGYILAFARQLPWSDRDVRAGKWVKRPCVALHECTLGVVGVGAIGKVVVQRALAFGMRVIGNDIAPVPASFVSETGLEMVSLDSLLAAADFVSLNCTLNPTSHHLIDVRRLALMKQTACLINTSRGPVIDEPALARALKQRRIAGAALDVFEEEPLPADSPLRGVDSCLLGTHNANNSPAAWRRVHERSLNMLVHELNAAAHAP